MWIVRLALRRPYTFVVAAMLIAILGLVMILRTPTDIFPEINIPVISVIFNYTGMSADDMQARIVTGYERILTTTVNDIEHIESQSLNGISVTKIFFQPNAKIEEAIAQVTAVSQTALRFMPNGTQPPLIIEYNASSVPILQLSLESDTLPESQLFDLAVNFLRPQLITIPGVQVPYPYGGKMRQIIVDLDPDKLYSYGVTPTDVSAAVNVQNLILPAGSTKIGKQEYQVRLNSSPNVANALNNLPIRSANGATVSIRDVAHVRDGFSVQTNIVHTNGQRGVLLSILKAGNASTLEVVSAIQKALPHIRTTLPPELKITPMFDQSLFVRASVEGVVKEAATAAGLTALMILLFLGSWRSTVIVMISIPLSILVSIIVLGSLGQTLNVMTLGGMALAVGILVDDATVEIENIHRNLHQRKRLVQAILDGASQIAVPAFVSTLCICIVFVPVVFITGAARYLFTPLAMAVVFAMLTSYLLSRTLVPTMVHYLLASEVETYGGVLDERDPHTRHVLRRQKAAREHRPCPPEDDLLLSRIRCWLSSRRTKIKLLVLTGLIAATLVAFGVSPAGRLVPTLHAYIVNTWHWILAHRYLVLEMLLALAAIACALWMLMGMHLLDRAHGAFDRAFERMRQRYGGMLAWALDHRRTVVWSFLTLVAVSCLLLLVVGDDFFPSVDAGQMRLHVRCPPGTRIEETERVFAQVEDAIRQLIPKDEIATMLDDMGIPNSGINFSLSDQTLISAADGEILISLTPDHHPTAGYTRTLRKELAKQFPDLTFFFAPSDIVTQVLNFGVAAPIDIQVTGTISNDRRNAQIARGLSQEVAKVPGTVDVRLQQVSQTPDLRVDVDRTLANQVTLTQQDVASDLLISLSSSTQVAPNFWLNPQNGVNYSVYVQTPQYRVASINDLENTPVAPTSVSTNLQNTQLLANLARTSPGSSPTNVTHYNISPSYDVLLGVQSSDLGSASDRLNDVIAKFREQLPRGSLITVRGQVQSMRSSFTAMAYGLLFAVILVYLLMVINFQSWLDPLIILMALPGAMAGILWMLWATHTSISVPTLMGAIMSIGVATSNSILMVTFANDQRKVGMNAHDAALSAGMTRLRPVIMTALAMIIGMLPMALGMGEGGEQNAPLGRAVIGGLAMATFATLFFVPVVYSRLRARAAETQVEEELR